MPFCYAIPSVPYCTCGQTFGLLYKLFYKKVKDNISPIEALEQLDVIRGCCKSRLLALTRYDMIDSAHNAFIDETAGIEKGFPDILPHVKITIIGIE